MKQKHKNTERPNLYGFHAVRAAWLNPNRDVQVLYMTQNAAKGFEQTLQQSKHLDRPQPIVLDNKSFDKLLHRDSVHQGVAASVSPLNEIDIQSLTISAKDNSLILILDQVTDPHNVGAILRSACAFGAHGIVMQRKHAPNLEGVLAKTASGAIEHVPVAFETNISRSIETLQDSGYFVYGLDERGEDIRNMKLGGKVALVLGAEGPGIRRLVKKHCDALFKIPMSGVMESINVSNAAAVALYALSHPP